MSVQEFVSSGSVDAFVGHGSEILGVTGDNELQNSQHVEIEDVNEHEVSDGSDSSDETYPESEANSTASEEFYSDVPSVVLGDVEWYSDEDIFVEKNMPKEDVIRKVKKIVSGRPKNGTCDKRKKNLCDVDVDWYSDSSKEDDDLLSFDGFDESAPKHLVYKEGQDMKKFELVVGMKFKNAMDFREVLRDYSVREGYELFLKKNENCRITAVCKKECDWRIHASLVMGGPTFQIKTIKGEHTCAKTHINSQANYSYLAKRIKGIVRDNPDIKIGQLKNFIRRKCAVDVSRSKVIRAKKAALEKIRGVDSVQYELLRDYCETVIKFNPGSKLLIRSNEDYNPPIFDKLYYSLHAMKMSFLSGCRPIIGLDGCFLKTVHGGQMLVAIGRDGNDNMVPISIAVVRVENRENWTWFLTELLEDIGGLGENKWTFISDRQKGLVEALKELVPDSEHRYCLRHMYENFRKKFKGLELKELFWKAATTGNKNEFDVFLKKIAQVDPKVDPKYETAMEWLQKIPAIHWARSHFSTQCKSDVLVNNLSESFNSYILDDREKPIITMLESIRNKLMHRIQVKRQGMEKHNGDICPSIMKKINKCQKMSRNCFAIYAGELEYQIQFVSSHGVVNQYVVDLLKGTCTCGMFQLCGYPCCHACTAIGESRHRIEDYVDKCYTKAEYMRIYSHIIHAVPGEIDYCRTNCQVLHAPVFGKKKGRPKKMRKKGADEGQSISTRKGLTHTCSKCLEHGHNKATCTNPIHPKSKLYKQQLEGPTQEPENQWHSSQASMTSKPRKPPPFSRHAKESEAAVRRLLSTSSSASAASDGDRSMKANASVAACASYQTSNGSDVCY